MLRILFTSEDLAVTRFLPEPAPLLETKLALLALRHGDRAPWHERWRHTASAALPAKARPLCELVAGFSGALSPTALDPTVDEALDTMGGLPAERARTEMMLWYGTDRAPRWLQHVAEGDRESCLILQHAFTGAFTAAVAPYWADIRARHHAELVRHGRLLACHGLAAALSSAVPGARWRRNCLEIPGPQRRTVRLGGRGLVLAPTAFRTGPPLVGDLPGHPVLLVYSPPAMAGIRVGDESDPLAGVLGATRSAVLRLLTDDHTTGDIARQLGISAASASEHAAALRAARLVTCRRDGKAVVHRATALGLHLIGANTR
ncbi:helix-turn-helix domain-containing protein [Nocardia mexicana]|uniref:ArsR family transcriptional regulator n=1 Tax=Nocardia mexicana TaxID=279262 RepID=A0A370HIT0_9NOCA|nr:helix-turn-helix domain-containing protein [Nocardia mexicana]RDI55379.1 ArsR family transcriptional regulator [Nocardia mexicana]